MGHDFQITSDPKPVACDLLIALHARKNAVGIRRMAKQFPHVPIVVVLTGTDLYQDIVGNQAAQHSLDLAKRLVGICSSKKSITSSCTIFARS